MKITNFKRVALALVLSAALFSCKKDAPEVIGVDPTVVPNYDNGFFLIHEGWFGHGTGSVSFYDAATGTLRDSIFQKENEGKGFESVTSTVQFGTVFNKNLYVVSKAKGPVVVADATTMKEVGRVTGGAGSDWHAFVGIDEHTGLLSSTTGIYKLDLKTFTVGEKLAGTTGSMGDMFKTDKYIYTLSQSEGLVIFNVADLTVKSKTPGVNQGFAKTPDGKIWYSGGKNLYKSDPETLVTETVELPFTANSTMSIWFSSPIIASTKENAVFMMNSKSSGGGKEIYKYVAGDKSSLDKPFITVADKQTYYKTNLGYYAKTDQIVTTSFLSGWGANSETNSLNIYDAKTGTLSKTIPFKGYYFPAMFAFHQ